MQVAQLRQALAERDAALEQLTLERRTIAVAHEEALREAEKAAYAAALRGEQLPRPSSPRLARAHARGHDQGARQAQVDADAAAAEVAAGAVAEVENQSAPGTLQRHRLPVMLADGDFAASSPLPARSRSDHYLSQGGGRGRSRSPQQQQQQQIYYGAPVRRSSNSDRPYSMDSTESSSGKRVAMAAARGDEAAVEAEVEKLREEARQVIMLIMKWRHICTAHEWKCPVSQFFCAISSNVCATCRKLFAS